MKYKEKSGHIKVIEVQCSKLDDIIEAKMKFAYINTQNIFPHDIHLIDGLRQLGHEVIEICDKSKGIKKYLSAIKHLKKNKKSIDIIIIGFTSPLLVPFIRFITLKKTIFNAVSSQYEANVISREKSEAGLLKTIKWLLIDFLSFHLASKILLESNNQIEYIRKHFFVPRKKLVRSWSGLNENEFFLDLRVKKRDDFTVLFRGRFLPESGILTVIQAAKLLENQDVRFLVVGHGFLYREVNTLMDQLSPKNLKMLNERLSIEKLLDIMLSCHISLGQLANHPRLERTLPCKLFESLALGLPYLTGRNKAALELLTENETCICVNPGDANNLAEKILFLKNNPKQLTQIGENGYKLYKSKLTSKKLAEQVITIVFNK